MYYFSVAALMFICPLLSIWISASMDHAVFGVALAARWFVFWAVGIRLLVAGLRQIAKPRYTAQVILGLKSDEVLLVVRELGFANVAIGSIGTLSLFMAGWTLPAALAGGVFYGLAGINHVMHGGRNRLQDTAMVTDLAAAILLLGFGCMTF
jgi:hypothetical protein